MFKKHVHQTLPLNPNPNKFSNTPQNNIRKISLTIESVDADGNNYQSHDNQRKESLVIHGKNSLNISIESRKSSLDTLKQLSEENLMEDSLISISDQQENNYYQKDVDRLQQTSSRFQSENKNLSNRLTVDQQIQHNQSEDESFQDVNEIKSPNLQQNQKECNSQTTKQQPKTFMKLNTLKNIVKIIPKEKQPTRLHQKKLSLVTPTIHSRENVSSHNSPNILKPKIETFLNSEKFLITQSFNQQNSPSQITKNQWLSSLSQRKHERSSSNFQNVDVIDKYSDQLSQRSRQIQKLIQNDKSSNLGQSYKNSQMAFDHNSQIENLSASQNQNSSLKNINIAKDLKKSQNKMKMVGMKYFQSFISIYYLFTQFINQKMQQQFIIKAKKNENIQ